MHESATGAVPRVGALGLSCDCWILREDTAKLGRIWGEGKGGQAGLPPPDWLGEPKHHSGLGRGCLSLNQAKYQQAVTTCPHTGIMHRSVRTEYRVLRRTPSEQGCGSPGAWFRRREWLPAVRWSTWPVILPPGRIRWCLGGDVRNSLSPTPARRDITGSLDLHRACRPGSGMGAWRRGTVEPRRLGAWGRLRTACPAPLRAGRLLQHPRARFAKTADSLGLPWLIKVLIPHGQRQKPVGLSHPAAGFGRPRSFLGSCLGTCVACDSEVGSLYLVSC